MEYGVEQEYRNARDWVKRLSSTQQCEGSRNHPEWYTLSRSPIYRRTYLAIYCRTTRLVPIPEQMIEYLFSKEKLRCALRCNTEQWQEQLLGVQSAGLCCAGVAEITV